MTDNKLKPLENYLKDIKSRNSRFKEKIPELGKTVEGISNYDDLYKKLIEESYYICNELLKTRDFQDKESFEGNNVERALKFSSNEQDNKIYNTMNNNYKQDSTFSLKHQNRVVEANNQFSSFEAADNRNFPIGQSFSKEPKAEVNKLQYFTENKNKHTDKNHLFSTTKNHNTFSSTVPIRFKPLLATAKEGETKVDKLQGDPKGLLPEELMLLVNNSKQIEGLLCTDNPLTKIEIFQSEIAKDIKKLNDIEINQQNLIESKQGLDIKMKDLNDLLNNFQQNFQKFETLANNYHNQGSPTNTERNTCENCKKGLNQQFSSTGLAVNSSKDNLNSQKETEAVSNVFSPRIQTLSVNHNDVSTFSHKNLNKKLNQSINNEISYAKKKNNICNKTFNGYHQPNNFQNYMSSSGALKNKNLTESTISMSNNMEDFANRSEIITSHHFLAASDRINSLFYDNLFREAVELWRQYNYENLNNCSMERTVEMLTIAAKIKDKEIEILNQKVRSIDALKKEVKDKNQEIVELFADLELMRDKIRRYEFQLNSYKNTEKKLNSLINENAVLYKENVKNKTLLEQEKVLNGYRKPVNKF